MPGDYEILATIYDDIDMGSFARSMIPRIINYAQQNDWMGRSLIDLGCGSGVSIEWLSQYGYITTGVDQSPDMLALARQRLDNPMLVQQDIRQLQNISDADMVFSLNVMNELDGINDLRSVFDSVQKVLKTSKLFIFDLYTIEGLFARFQRGDRVAYSTANDMIFSTNKFDYDKQVHERNYIIFKKQGDLWQRTQASRTLRAYPVQAIAALLQRTGFKLSSVLNTNLERHDPNTSGTLQVIFIAEKQ